jgi:hypothetical protein
MRRPWPTGGYRVKNKQKKIVNQIVAKSRILSSRLWKLILTVELRTLAGSPSATYVAEVLYALNRTGINTTSPFDDVAYFKLQTTKHRSVIGISTRLRARQSVVRTLRIAKDCSLAQRVQDGSGPNPAFYSVGTGGKVAGSLN